MVEILLRNVIEADLTIFFGHYQDADALYMAAFTPPLPIDKAALMSHWRKIFADESFAPPVHLFVTGSHSPARQKKDNKQRHLLSKKDFIEEMRNLDGCPEEILLNEELLGYFEPILRVDFETAETFRYRQQPPIDIPLTVMTGAQEDFEEEDIHLWQQETSQPAEFHQFEGKHFFIFQHTRAVLNIISEKLLLTTKLYQ